MRAHFAITKLAVAAVVAVAMSGAARAADFVSAPSHGVRAPQLLVYDNQPGIYVRTYWAPPWQNRHYYPFTGKKPKIGRHEDLTAVRAAPEPAESFYREWSTISLYPPPPLRADVPLPIEQPLGHLEQ